MKNLLILGATGKTGKILTQLALDAGYLVTVLVRSPDKLNIKHQQLDVIQGDVINYYDVQKVVQGQDAVLSTLGRDGKKTEVITVGTKNIIAAMNNERVQRLICMSSLGSGSTKNKMGIGFSLIVYLMGLKKSFDAKAQQEQMLNASGLDYTLVHAGSLTDFEENSIANIQTLLPSGVKKSWTMTPGKISRKQVGMFMLQELEQPLWLKKTVCIFE